MAAPVDSARQGTNISTAGTSHAINVGSPVSGTLLIVFVRFAAAPGTVTFTGYTSIVSDSSDAADDTTQVFWRWADGTEGATDTLTTANSVKLGAICWEVTGAQNEQPNVSTVVVGTTTANTANSGSVAPVSAPRDTLYISMCGGDGEVGAYTAVPTNYANLVVANSGTGGAAASNCFIGGASRQITSSSSDDAGAFTHAAHTTGWTGFAVAIREAVAGTNFTRNVDDTLSLADSTTVSRGIKLAPADTLSLADSVADVEGWRRLPADTLSLADSLARMMGFARAVSDSVTASDGLTRAVGFVRSFGDSVTLSDAITPLIVIVRQVADSLSLADALSLALGRTRTVDDTLSLADAVDVDLIPVVGEPPPVTIRARVTTDDAVTLAPGSRARARARAGRAQTMADTESGRTDA